MADKELRQLLSDMGIIHLFGSTVAKNKIVDEELRESLEKMDMVVCTGDYVSKSYDYIQLLTNVKELRMLIADLMKHLELEMDNGVPMIALKKKDKTGKKWNSKMS